MTTDANLRKTILTQGTFAAKKLDGEKMHHTVVWVIRFSNSL